MNKADTIDHYLNASILRNQGVILEQHGFIETAIQKYKEALPHAYSYSTKLGLSVKYNLGRAFALLDLEKSLQIFLEALEEAKKKNLIERQAKIYDEIGKMFTRTMELDEAHSYFTKALSLPIDEELRGRILHNYSLIYLYQSDWINQEEWLLKALKLKKGANRFVSLLDLGECYLNQGKLKKSRAYLNEAESYYLDQPLRADYIKLFELLGQVYPNEHEYAWRFGNEYKELVLEQQTLEFFLKKEGMKNLLLRLTSEKLKQEKIKVYRNWAIVGFVLAILIFALWRYRKYRLRKVIGDELIQQKVISPRKKN